MSNYFDFHIHPMFKQFISHYEDTYPSGRDRDVLVLDIVPDNDIMHMIDQDILHFLGSQCSLNQLKNGLNMLGVANIVALEYAIASANNIFGKILQGKLTDPLDKRYFDKVKNGTISYYHLFIKEANLYSALANTGSSKADGKTAFINLLTRKNNTVDLDNPTLPTFALAMEGGHNLNRNLVNDPLLNPEVPPAGSFDSIYADFLGSSGAKLTPAQSLVSLFKALWAEEMDLVYLTLTHLTFIKEQALATHAYGMKLLKHDHFFPSGSGLTPAGIAVIDAAYGMNIGGKPTPVLIDIKHMSLKSRLDFYQYRDDNNLTYPILATHVGLTGYKIPEWINNSQLISDPGAVKEIKTVPRNIARSNSSDPQGIVYCFNPWSINLMDEDITRVLESKGMIGISLDKHVIGTENMRRGVQDEINLDNLESEYLSSAEYEYLFLQKIPHIYDEDALVPEIDADSDTDLDVDPERRYNTIQRDKLKEIVNFALHILHIVAVGINTTDVDPWSHIVVGSDYDGLINPLIPLSSEKFIGLTDIEKYLPGILITAEGSYLQHFPGYPRLILPRNGNKVDIDGLKTRVRKIMYDNGKNFLKKWYDNNL